MDVLVYPSDQLEMLYRVSSECLFLRINVHIFISHFLYAKECFKKTSFGRGAGALSIYENRMTGQKKNVFLKHPFAYKNWEIKLYLIM